MSWLDGPSPVNSFYSRKADVAFVVLLGGLGLLIALLAGPVLGLLIGGGAIATGVAHGVLGRSRTGGSCSEACRTSPQPIEDCDCVCAGYRHGTETR